MRLALKLLSSLALLTIVTLGLSAIVEHRRQNELLAMDIEAESRMAGALRAVLLKIVELDGSASAKQVVDTLNANTPRNIRWLEPSQVPSVPGNDLRAEVDAHMATGEPIWVHWPDTKTGEAVRYLYIPLARDGKPIAVIEASESMAPRTAYVKHGNVQTAALGFVVLGLSGALAAVLGSRMVGRPVAALVRSVRTIGDGDFVPPAMGPRRDELGSLAVELSALGTRLAERERLRHDDRLRTVGQLASGVAHELGTPLSVVAVRARLIATREAMGDEAVANATAILEQSERMTRLIRQLLDYSRRSTGAAGTVDLRQTALQAVEMLEPLARGRAVSVVVEADPGDVQVRGDGSQLQQVVTNLVMNAVQAMPAGGKVEIRTGRSAAERGRASRPEDRCWIRVSDQGPGIPPDDLPHIFDPFFTTKPAGEGTGLGLAVAQAIVEEHGGWIAVHSEPGRGTMFTAFLPPLAGVAAERLAS
jgi:two-component system, NtrC family, sensor kinase